MKRKHRIDRLPKWAQRYIEGLERRIDGPPFLLAPGAVNTFTLTRKELAAAIAVTEADQRRRYDLLPHRRQTPDA